MPIIKSIFKSIFLTFILCVPLGGCFSTGGELLLYSPDRTVAKNAYDEDIRNYVEGLAKGPEVEGNDCESAIFGLIPLPPSFHIMPSKEKAFASAIEKAGPQYNALIHVNWSFTQYLVPPPLLRIICWDISGVAVRNKPYFHQAGSTPQKTSIEFHDFINE